MQCAKCVFCSCFFFVCVSLSFTCVFLTNTLWCVLREGSSGSGGVGGAGTGNLLTVHPPGPTHQQPRPPRHLPLKQTTLSSCSATPVTPQPTHNSDQPTVAEASLPWRRSQHVTGISTQLSALFKHSLYLS
jgi:hypothetical protein